MKSTLLTLVFILTSMSAQAAAIKTGAYTSEDTVENCALIVREVKPNELIVTWIDNGPDYNCADKKSQKFVKAKDSVLYVSAKYRIEILNGSGFLLEKTPTIYSSGTSPLYYSYSSPKGVQAKNFKFTATNGWSWYESSHLCAHKLCTSITEADLIHDKTCEASQAKAFREARNECRRNYENGECKVTLSQNLIIINSHYAGCESTVKVTHTEESSIGEI